MHTLAFALLVAALLDSGRASPLLECDGENQFVADTDSLCVFYQCANGVPYEFACAKGTRVPSYYTKGASNPCKVKTKKTVVCSRCNVTDDIIPDANVTNQCAIYQPCATRPGCTCIDQVKGYYCSCPEATTSGPTPKNELVPLCVSNVCQHGGTCYSLYKNDFCNCVPPWTGKNCEVNGCDSMVCNNGVCAYDKFGIYCQCEACFTGSCCDVALQIAACAGCNECVGGNNCTEVRTHLCKCNPCPNPGETCIDGVFKIQDRRCVRGPSTASDSFVLMFEENLSNAPAGLEVYVSAASDDGIMRHVTVDAPLGSGDCTYSDTAVIAPGDVHKFEVNICLKHIFTEVNNYGIRVRETNGKLINVYCINRAQFSADGWLALPDKVAGRYFVVISYAPITTASQFSFVAISDGTIVNVYLSTDSEQLTCTGPRCRFIQVNLAAYQTFQVSSIRNDLSGTVIESNKPIHVYSGEARAWVSPSPVNPYYSANVPAGSRSRDNLILECTSIETWGYTYAIVPLPRSVIGYNYTEEVARVAGSVPTACMLYATRSPPANFTSLPINLNAANNYVEQFYMDAEYNYFLACDHPVMLVEITESAIQAISFDNDPSFISGVAYSSYTNYYHFVPPQYSVTNSPYKYVYVRLAAIDPEYKQILINNELLFPTPPAMNPVFKPWTQIYVPPFGTPTSEYPQSDLYGAIFTLANNVSSSIIHPNPTVRFMCIVEGYDNRESFGIALGADIRARRNDSATSFSSVLASPHGSPDLILP